MKRLFEEFGFSLFVIVSGLMMIGLFIGLVNNNEYCDSIINNYQIDNQNIEYKKDKIISIMASDFVVNNKEEIQNELDKIKAYSKYQEIDSKNIYTSIEENDGGSYKIKIMVKYNDDYLVKEINCYINDEEEVIASEDNI